MLLPFNFTWEVKPVLHLGTLECIQVRHRLLHLKEIIHMPDSQLIIGILKILLYTVNKTLTIHNLRNTEKVRERKQKIQP